MKWRTNDGQEIEIAGMETRHIINCLRMLKRTWGEIPEYSEHLTADGDGCNGVLFVAGRDYYLPFIKAFKQELRRRGVTLAPATPHQKEEGGE